jgi:hypothetical protein
MTKINQVCFHFPFLSHPLTTHLDPFAAGASPQLLVLLEVWGQELLRQLWRSPGGFSSGAEKDAKVLMLLFSLLFASAAMDGKRDDGERL